CARATPAPPPPGGQVGLYEAPRALVSRPARRGRPFQTPLDARRVSRVPPPPVTPLATEAHALLDAVRRGAGLIYIASTGSQLDDSLHVSATGSGTSMVPLTDRPDLVKPCPAQDAGSPAINWFDDSVHLYGLASKRAWPDDTTLFVAVRTDTHPPPRE